MPVNKICTKVGSESHLISLLMEVLTEALLDKVWQGNTASSLARDVKGLSCVKGLLNPCLDVSVPVCQHSGDTSLIELYLAVLMCTQTRRSSLLDHASSASRISTARCSIHAADAV